MAKTGWKQDAKGYLWYYEPSSRKEYGTIKCPFEPAVLRNTEGKIADCYLILPAKLPTGSYELTEVKAPEGYVLNGAEEELKDTGRDRNHSYEIVSLPEIQVKVIASCCAGVTPASHEAALTTMQMCQIKIENN